MAPFPYTQKKDCNGFPENSFVSPSNSGDMPGISNGLEFYWAFMSNLCAQNVFYFIWFQVLPCCIATYDLVGHSSDILLWKKILTWTKKIQALLYASLLNYARNLFSIHSYQLSITVIKGSVTTTQLSHSLFLHLCLWLMGGGPVTGAWNWCDEKQLGYLYEPLAALLKFPALYHCMSSCHCCARACGKLLSYYHRLSAHSLDDPLSEISPLSPLTKLRFSVTLWFASWDELTMQYYWSREQAEWCIVHSMNF